MRGSRDKRSPSSRWAASMRCGACRRVRRSISSCWPPTRSSSLTAAGRVDPASRIDLARSGVAIAVAAGAPRPDIASESAVRDAVLRARTIGYSTGPSGAHLVRLFERWGIARRDRVAHRASVARRPGGHPRGAWRCRAGLPATERIDALAGHRRRRPASRRDPGAYRVLGGDMHGVRARRGRRESCCRSLLHHGRRGEAAPRHGTRIDFMRVVPFPVCDFMRIALLLAFPLTTSWLLQTLVQLRPSPFSTHPFLDSPSWQES